MTDSKRPAPGTPEFEQWLEARAKEHFAGVFAEETKADEPQRGLLCGDPKQFASSPEESAKEDLITHDLQPASASGMA